MSNPPVPSTSGELVFDSSLHEARHDCEACKKHGFLCFFLKNKPFVGCVRCTTVHNRQCIIQHPVGCESFFSGRALARALAHLQPCADFYAARDAYQAGNPSEAGIWKKGDPYIDPYGGGRRKKGKAIALVWNHEPALNAEGFPVDGGESSCRWWVMGANVLGFHRGAEAAPEEAQEGSDRSQSSDASARNQGRLVGCPGGCRG